jgi:hypothetical protein
MKFSHGETWYSSEPFDDQFRNMDWDILRREEGFVSQHKPIETLVNESTDQTEAKP